ncbi:MAG: NAD(P)H-hydrate dehydratase [Spirochaetes bacterium]|nr:NAD(P)H-hydrate dehydratase [Spirochaetota bacterium]
MKVVTASEIQNIDRETIDNICIPGEVLMGYAGKSISDYIISEFKGVKKTAIFCGTGNNGGDGFVIAYFLSNSGYHVDVFVAGVTEKISDTSRIYYNICRNFNINIISLTEQNIYEFNFSDYDLIIDAMVGTGFEGIPRGIIKDIIIQINKSSVKVLSVDLPSGLSSDGQAPEGDVINAHTTVTIGLPKISLVTYPGMKYTGNLVIREIGFPAYLSESSDLHVDLIDDVFAGTHLNINRDIDSHKGSVGHLLLIGGFDNMEGAIMMSAMAAFETGVGLATLLTTPKAREIIAGRIPELITGSINSDAENIDLVFKEDRQYNSLVIGPGMGRSEFSKLVFKNIIGKLDKYGIKKVLIDGDGLFHLSEYLKTKSLPQNINFVITPHFGEASGLLNKKSSELAKNRFNSAILLAEKTSAVTLLKGPATIVSDGKYSLINTTGNRAMSTAGSGDVLSGIIGALLLKNNCLHAAGIGAYIHGLAADMCVKHNDLKILKATDIISYLRPALANSYNSSIF